MRAPLILLAAALAAAGAAAGALAAAGAAAAAQPGKPHDQALRQTLADGLAEQADQRERAVHKLVEDGIRSRAWPLPAGSRTRYLTLREAALRALRRGLDARISRLAPDIAEAALQEALAVFDPVFSLTVEYQGTDTHRRAMEATVQRKSFTPSAPTGYICVETGLSPSLSGSDGKCPKDDTRPSPAVIALGYLQQTSGIEVREIEASSDDLNNTDVNHAFTYTATLTQQLPWGAAVSLSHQTYQKRIYYRENKYWADADITANLYVSATTPLPFTKGFGRDAAGDALVRQQAIARTAADWQVQYSLNQILLQVDQAWWDLVARLEELRVLHRSLERADRRVAKLERKYDLFLATDLDRHEALTEQSRVRALWQDAARAFLAASASLGSLIESDPQALLRTVWLPSAYTPLFEQWPDIGFEQAWAVARQWRPDLHVEEAWKQIAKIDVDVARNQLRPDLALTADGALTQNHDVYGYGDAMTATEQLADPDEIYLGGTLSYTYPVGNRAARARLEQKRLALADQILAVHSAEDVARTELRDALALLAANRERAALARREAGRLEDALKRLGEVREATGEVSGSEMTQTDRRLQSALLTHIAAVTAAKKAEGQVLAAQGLLPGRYGERAAVTEFDRRRLERLVRSGALSRFADPTARTGP